MDQNDSLDEIATTDAWRNLISMLERCQNQFERDVITACKQIDFKATEAARRAGRVEAIEHVLQTLRKIGAKRDAS